MSFKATFSVKRNKHIFHTYSCSEIQKLLIYYHLISVLLLINCELAMACTAATEMDNPSPDDLMVFEEVEVGSEDECDGHEKVLEDELQKMMVSPAETFSQTVAHTEPLAKLKSICEQIYKDVTRLPRIGNPGNLVVFRDNSFAIAATSHGHGVYIAASEVGNGRIAFLSSDIMCKGILGRKGKGQLAILHENIIQWVTNSQERTEETKLNIRQLAKVEKLQNVNIKKAVVVALHLTDVIDRSDEILEYVKRGGGFVIARNPHNWSGNHTESLQTGHPFFVEIGIAVTLDRVFVPTDNHNIHLTDEFYHSLLAAHAGHWLESCNDTPTEKIATLVKPMKNTLNTIPDFALKEHEDKLSALFKKCFDHLDGKGPSRKNVVEGKSKIGAAGVCCLLLNKKQGPAIAPGVELFPGNVKKKKQLLQSAEVEIKVRNKISECHPTGYYLLPGQELIVTVLNDAPLENGWLIRIGAHSDKLFGKKSLNRWPDIVFKESLSGSRQVKLYSPYGGNLYIRCPDRDEVAKLRLENVVETPYVNLDDPKTVSNWESGGKNAPGLWADVCGKHIRFTLPSASVRNLVDIKLIMETWDRVMLAHLGLRGTDPMSHRKEWIVYDAQISAGSMHSGYPVMGLLGRATNPKNEKFVLSVERITTSGAWGPYHELGHNMQRGAWTFKGMREVTCNIFALHAIDVVAGVPVGEHSKLNDPQRLKRFTQHFKQGAPYEDWHTNLPLALAFYAHLAHTFGWDTYKAVFAEYESLPAKQHPRQNNEKINQWLTTFSKHAGYDIAPMMDLWGVAYTEEGHKLVTQAPFLPEDKITSLHKKWTDQVLAKYPDIVREKVIQ